MRLSPAWIVVSASALGLWLAGCDNGKQHLHPDAGPDARPDAPPLKWWRPELGTAKNWDVQRTAPFDLTATRTMYDLDLWTLVPAGTTIDYGDGDPVTVPAGPLAGKIAELHAQGTIVICHVDTGAIHLGDPDARKFPGFTATPPDRPTPPDAGSVIGWSPLGSPTERFLDIRTAGRALWAAKIWKRLDLAKQLGCDGIEGDRNDMITSDPGFTISVGEQNSWYQEIATQVHARELSAGMKDGVGLAGQADMFADDFDWLMVERCGEHADCDPTRPFINLHRVVFAIDYDHDEAGDVLPAAGPCNQQQRAQITEGLIKDVALTGAVRMQCTP